MTASGSSAVPDQIQDAAHRFRAYLLQGTDIELLEIGAVNSSHGPDVLVTAIERLDLALAQLIDLASVYSDDPRMSIEPLAVPTAALLGEYLRAALSAAWVLDDDHDTGESLVIALPNGIAADLTGVSRAALFSAAPNFSAVIEALLAEGTG
jgi:hypothetical protein